MNSTPLEPGKLAPNFALTATGGTVMTRSQFRNKAGLVLIFTPTPGDPGMVALLHGIERDQDAYHKLGARVFVVTRTVSKSVLPTLFDADGKTWQQYSGGVEAGYGVFVLDKYGGVDSQIVTDDPAALPDAPTVREWVQAAMYRCNI